MEPSSVIHPDVEYMLSRALPFDSLTVHVKLRPLDVEGGEPVVVPPEARQTPEARGMALASYKRAQKLRYGETLIRLREHVSTNLRGSDDLPLTDYVVAWGYRDAIRKISTLAGVSEICMPTVATKAT